ncbi:hypothetical protein [Streptomyces mobaraensis]|uniref:Uncharacterized protein n=1 Tax=Streptomyces mobaraensis TaxID=35621 RepID=A0A5N5WE02_STRMB|nr:hypothetical protein [Streptomyces mobaraensis]KAB7850160.1 hypothetical protein FRZ00_06060 [Streptomyces mobaraensis]
MNLLTLRNLIGKALTIRTHGLDNGSVTAVRFLNAPAAGGEWGMRVVVDDGTGTGATRAFQISITEE